jgi:hypothetical protein
MVGALPRIHELAAQAGIELPSALGKINERAGVELAADKDGNGKA